MQLTHIQRTNEFECFFKTLLSLAPCTYNHIHTDKGIRHQFLHTWYLLCKKICSITATHKLQHFITTALQWYMKMRHKRTRLCTISQYFLSQQIGFDGRYTITGYTFHPVKRFHQIQKALAGGLTEISDIHSGQHYFTAALRCCLFCLTNQWGYATVTATPTSVWNRTIRTIVIASVLHLQKITCSVATWTGRDKCMYIFRRYCVSLVLRIS